MASLLTSADLERALPMADAIEAVEGALAERAARTMVSPARTVFQIPPSAVTITPGGLRDQGVVGFRAYLWGGSRDQLTAVWNFSDGRLEGVIVGSELGEIRTGAIGGAACRRMAPAAPRRVGVIGGGRQAHAQLLALRVVRPSISEVRVYRRDPDRRRETAARWALETGLDVQATETAEEAVRGADVVLLATNSATPVVKAEWLAPGAHVNSLGPKYSDRTEIGMDLIEGADVLACDYPEQYRREEDFLLHGTPHLARMQDLAELPATPRMAGTRSVFLSHGLAGTEVAVAQRAFENARRDGIGTSFTP